MLRTDAYLAEVVRLDQLADRAAGLEAGLAVDQLRSAGAFASWRTAASCEHG